MHNTSTRGSLYDDRYGYPGFFKLNHCESCGHKFLTGKLPTSLTDLYTKYYPRSNFDIDQFSPHQKPNLIISWLNGGLSSAFRWVPERVRVLDVGCGFGETLGYHASRGCEVHGVDADENILRVGQRFGYNVIAGDFSPSNYQNDYFDYVTMDQVIEHTPDPVQTLADVARVLKPGGTCILSTPNSGGWGAKLFGVKWLNWHAPYHLHFFSRSSIQTITSKTTLDIVSIQTVTRSEWLIYQLLHMATFPKHSETSAFWDSKKARKKLQSTLIKVSILARFTLIPHLITRVMDGLGIGDNLVILLRKPSRNDR